MQYQQCHHQYQYFFRKECISAAFIDVQDTYDAVHIPSINRLNRFIQSLFSCRNLHFVSPFGVKESSIAYIGGLL